MPSGRVNGGWDAMIDKTVTEDNGGGQGHRVKWMPDEGPMTETNPFQRPGGSGPAEPKEKE